MVINTKMQIVKVKYFNESVKRFIGREYSYFSEEPLKVGDIVIVPVRDTTGKAQVSAVDIPDSEIEKFRDAVKTIPAGSVCKEDSVTSDPVEVATERVSETIPNTINETHETTSLTNITQDADYIALSKEVAGLAKYAESRIIKTEADIKTATDDLGLIGKLMKSIEDLRSKYVKPLNEKLKAINGTFKELTNPLDQANAITRQKIMAYRQEVERLRKEAEEINRQKEELAKKEAAFNGTGEVTINTTPVIIPQETAKTVRTETATMGTRKIRKAKVVDFAKLPDIYKLPNQRMLDAAAATGVQEIPGVQFYVEESLIVRGK